MVLNESEPHRHVPADNESKPASLSNMEQNNEDLTIAMHVSAHVALGSGDSCEGYTATHSPRCSELIHEEQNILSQFPEVSEASVRRGSISNKR